MCEKKETGMSTKAACLCIQQVQTVQDGVAQQCRSERRTAIENLTNVPTETLRVLRLSVSLFQYDSKCCARVNVPPAEAGGRMEP
jgi:hypothetical protein